MLRAREDRVDGPLFDDAPGVHHGDAVGHLGDHAEVVGDEQQGKPVFGLKLAQQVQNLGLNGDVERRCRLVGDDQSDGLHASAMAISTRWR